VLTNNVGGSIRGGTGIFNSSKIGALNNSGSIVGTRFAINGGVQVAGQSLSIFGGSGSTFGPLTNGTINVANGNLYFTGGNTHLDEDIKVNDGGGTVVNTGVLQLSNSHVVNGNFEQDAPGTWTSRSVAPWPASTAC
jgi:hypothetical protein